MEELVGLGFGSLAGVLLFVILIVIAIYVVEGIFLFKLNKVMYGKGTPMAFIPFANTYLLGKLTVNKTIGWILVIGSIVTSNASITLNGEKQSLSLLPAPLSSIVGGIISIANLGLFIYAIVKYFNIKNGKISPNEENINQNVTQTEIPQNSNIPGVNQDNLNTNNTTIEQTNMSSLAENNMISAPILDQTSNAQTVEQPQNVVSESTATVELQQPVQAVQANSMVQEPVGIMGVEQQPVEVPQANNMIQEPIEKVEVQQPVEISQTNNLAQQNQTLNAFSMKPTNQEVSSESEIKSSETVETTTNNNINQ